MMPIAWLTVGKEAPPIRAVLYDTRNAARAFARTAGDLA